MRFKLTAFLAFFVFFTTINAQINYTKEEVEKRYNTETIILQPNAFEKNGVSTSMNTFFPNAKLRQEIETNGGREANDQYKKYKKMVGVYWLVSILGILAAVLFLSSVGATITQAQFLVYLLGVAVLSTAAFAISKKIYQYLSRAVWYHNKNVLLRK
jgi:cation transport ATPase